jgi:hypothetical protein
MVASATLCSSARYQPPLGLLGSAADRALLHRVAEATIRDFVQRLAQAILIEASTAEQAAAPSLIDSPLDP